MSNKRRSLYLLYLSIIYFIIQVVLLCFGYYEEIMIFTCIYLVVIIIIYLFLDLFIKKD